MIAMVRITSTGSMIQDTASDIGYADHPVAVKLADYTQESLVETGRDLVRPLELLDAVLEAAEEAGVEEDIIVGKIAARLAQDLHGEDPDNDELRIRAYQLEQAVFTDY